MSGATTAVLARREETCQQFQWLLESSSNLLARALPTLGSANSADSVSRRDSWHSEPEQRYTWIHLTVPQQPQVCGPKSAPFSAPRWWMAPNSTVFSQKLEIPVFLLLPNPEATYFTSYAFPEPILYLSILTNLG